jgi:hypothetical protein
MLLTWIHPLHSIREAVSAIVIVDSQRPGNDVRVCWRHGSVCVDVVSSPARVHDNGMRGSKGRPAGNEVDELGETKHIGDSRRRDIGSTVLSFSFVSGARCEYRKSRSKPTACGGGGISTYGTSRPRLVRPRPIRRRERLTRMELCKGPAASGPLARQALHVTHRVGHREQTRANRL